MQLAYIGSYRDPNYIRGQSILRALGSRGGIELLVACNRSTGMARYIETWRALRQLRKTHKPDIYILGFRGHEIFWPVRWLTRGTPLIFDALMSPSAALREESKAGWMGWLAAPAVRLLERGILRHADLILTDTVQHETFYEAQFGLTKQRMLAIPVGAVEQAATLRATEATNNDDGDFSVLFYGSMLPLHGTDTIVAAAAQLSDLPIRFDFIGGTARQARRLRESCCKHGVTRYTHCSWVPLPELVAHMIPRANLCLGGPFGGTPQAMRVITSKTSQCLALGKATVVGEVGEDIGFEDKGNCMLVPQGDAAALAAAIRWSFSHRETLLRIGRRGQALYRERLSTDVIAQRLIPAVERLCPGRQL